ncbi:MAG: right-handed parallel beta-helix repeat-containing protein [Fibrobacterales bacterium]
MLKSMYCVCCCILFLQGVSYGAQYVIGLAAEYRTPNELYKANVVSAGDTISIEAGEYVGTDALAHWAADSLLIRGVGGRPHLKASEEYIMGKGIWVVSGDYTTIENIEFSGAQVPDKNGAGIRLEGANDTIRRCSFHHNENGILTIGASDGDLVIEFTEFGYSGHGKGYTHNVYVGNYNKLVFQNNYSHHAHVGHNLKSRADSNVISYNRLSDDSDGFSSRLVDLPNGGHSVLMGNVLMQGVNAPNYNLIGYGLEGLTNKEPHELYLINNTLVNENPTSGTFVHAKSGTQKTVLSNNIFAGVGTLINGDGYSGDGNFVEPFIGQVGFVDASQFDYRLLEASPVIDGGTVLEESLIPRFHYVHKANATIRVIQGAVDIGAYEYLSENSDRDDVPETKGSSSEALEGASHVQLYSSSSDLEFSPKSIEQMSSSITLVASLERDEIRKKAALLPFINGGDGLVVRVPEGSKKYTVYSVRGDIVYEGFVWGSRNITIGTHIVSGVVFVQFQ